MRILALDLAASTGWAARWPDGRITSGTERLYGDAAVKLGNLLVWLEGMLPTEAIVIEKALPVKAASRPNLVGYAAVAAAVARKHGLAFEAYHNATIKKAVTGNGRADKAAVRKLVLAQTGIRAKTDDESDAIAVLLTHEHRLKSERHLFLAKQAADLLYGEPRHRAKKAKRGRK